MAINKKFLSAYAALCILLYHLWAFLGNSVVENFIIKTMFVGVDIFFFLSAYSLADKKLTYGPFVLNRFLKVYCKFIVFAIVAAFVKKWSFWTFIQTITGIGLFVNGGGSFLWFAPAIMIFYLLYPWFTRWAFKGKGILVLLCWAIIGVVISLFTEYNAMFIFFNRIPVILLGYYAKTVKIQIPKWIGFILVPLGVVLMYFFGFKMRLNTPLYDMMYLSVIPFVFGVALLSGYLKDNVVTKFLSGFTFELYGLQMIFGGLLANTLLMYIDFTIVSNLLMIIIMLALSFAVSLLFGLIEKAVSSTKKSKE